MKDCRTGEYVYDILIHKGATLEYIKSHRNGSADYIYRMADGTQIIRTLAKD